MKEGRREGMAIEGRKEGRKDNGRTERMTMKGRKERKKDGRTMEGRKQWQFSLKLYTSILIVLFVF